MYIQTIELKNYRNYQHVSVDFDPSVNIIYGENAQGKTNLIEAIYMCATSKSHRLSKDNEIVRLGEDAAHIHLNFMKEDVEEVIDMHLKVRGKKNIAINKMSILKLNELFGMVNVIMFSPEDLGLIKNGPKERRRFIDLELSQLNPLYMYYLSHYHKVLKQRNKLLKSTSSKEDILPLIEVFDEQLSQYGFKVIEMREEFIEALNPVYKEKHYQISGGKESVNLVYERSCEKENFKKMLSDQVDKDLRRKTTSVGPHRDDLMFMMNGIDLRRFGSQGQQRTAALSLKLSEIDLVKSQIDDTPILLLDDVLSELDHNRQIYLTSHLEDIQTFITCTGVEDFVTNTMQKYQLYEVKSGNVTKMS